MKDEYKSNLNSNSSSRLDDCHRKFNDLPTKFSKQDQAGDDDTISWHHPNLLHPAEENKKCQDLFELINHSEIGRDQTFVGPFGSRKGDSFISESEEYFILFYSFNIFAIQ